MVEVGLDPDLAHGGNQLDERLIEKPHRQGDGNACADADDVHMGNRGEIFEEETELGGWQGKRIATREDHIADLGMLAHILNHALIIAADRFPSAAHHGCPLACAETAIH